MSVPITATQHALSLDKLSGSQFEHLCLDLMAHEGYEPITDYGACGGPDGGRDFEGWRDGRRVLFQCKNVKVFRPADVKSELEKVRKLPDAQQPDAVCFLIAIDPTPATIDAAKKAWWGHSKDCRFLCGRQLSTKVHNYPEIVERFFGLKTTSRRERLRVPHPGDDFVPRREVDKVIDLLSGEAEKESKSSSLAIRIALQGSGGFGKTTLAQAICHDSLVEAMFSGGVLWVHLGEGLKETGRKQAVLDALRQWIGGSPPEFDSVASAGLYLCQELNGQRVLLVLDDAWHPEDIRPFEGLSAGSALLITTRNRDILPFSTRFLDVDEMDPGEAIQLLSIGIDADGMDFVPLTRRLGAWPLLLGLANRQLRKLMSQGMQVVQALHIVESKLERKGLTALDRRDAKARADAVRLTIEAGFESGFLSTEDQECYFSLAIFPRSADIPLSTLATYWGLDLGDTFEVVERLFDFSLLQRFDHIDGAESVIRLHDIFHHYVVGAKEGQMPAMHRLFLEAHQPGSGFWADLSPTEIYLWRHLVYHFSGAGDGFILRQLFLDFNFLLTKLKQTGLNRVLEDVNEVFAGSELNDIVVALRMSANVLAEDSDQLAGQILGRLLGSLHPEVVPLLESARNSKGLFPKTRSLEPPGGRLAATLVGHKGKVLDVAVIGNDQVVSASDDHTLRVWKVSKGTYDKIWKGHEDRVLAVKVLSCGRVASASSDRTIKIWDLNRKSCEETLRGHRDEVLAIGDLGNGRIVSASADRTLRVWEIGSDQREVILKGHASEVLSVEVVDSGRVISISTDGSLRLWDTESGDCLEKFYGHLEGVLDVKAFSGQNFVSASSDGNLRVWDLKSEDSLLTLGERFSEALVVDVLVDGRFIAGYADGSLRIWNTETKEVESTLNGHEGEILAVCVLKDGRVVSSSSDNTLRLWDIHAYEEDIVLSGHTDSVIKIVSISDRQVISASLDGSLRVWNIQSDLSTTESYNRSSRINIMDSLGSSSVVSGDSGGKLRVWDSEHACGSRLLGVHGDRIFAVAAMGCSSVLSAASDTKIQVWDSIDGGCIRVLEGHEGWVFDVKSLGNHRVISCSEDTMVRVWDLHEESESRAMDGHKGWVRGVRPLSGNRAISFSDDGTLRLWCLKSKSCRRVFEGHSGWVVAVEFLDSDRVVSASSNGEIMLWSLQSKRCQQSFTGHSDHVVDIKGLGGNRIVSASRDGTICVWDVSKGRGQPEFKLSGKEIRALEHLGHDLIAIASSDSKVRILDLGRESVVASFTAEAAISSLARLGPRTIVAGDDRGQVHILDWVE